MAVTSWPFGWDSLKSDAARRSSSRAASSPGTVSGANRLATARQDRRHGHELLLRAQPGPREHRRQDPAEPGDRAHRAVGLRQVDVPPVAQPDERHHPRRPGRGLGPDRRPRHLRAVGRRRRPAAAGRHGVPEVEPVSEVDLRERRLRPADQPHGRVARRAARPGRGQPEGGGALGRSEGPAAHLGARALRRPAAAAVHRARAGGRARDPADGRAGVGARPDRHAAHRRADLPAEDPLHDRDRDAQHAAGGAGLGRHGVLLARQAGRVRPDRTRFSPLRPRS